MQSLHTNRKRKPLFETRRGAGLLLYSKKLFKGFQSVIHSGFSDIIMGYEADEAQWVRPDQLYLELIPHGLDKLLESTESVEARSLSPVAYKSWS